LLRAALLVAGCLLSGIAHADVYTWRDATGVTRMSNMAPPWYRDTEPSRPRTQVLVNGHLVDDTGLSREQRTKLQAGRARAESWGKGSPPPAAQVFPVPVPVAANAGAAKPAAQQIPEGVPAQALEGMKRALEAQQLADKLAEELKASNRPR
jgi:hypothetical protein